MCANSYWRSSGGTPYAAPEKVGAVVRHGSGGLRGPRATSRTHLAPFYVNEGLFPPVDGAPVLAVVKQTALDDGCGPALLQGVGNGSKNGLAGAFRRG